MLFSFSMKQVRRTPVRTVTWLLLMVIVCGFLCVSIHLRLTAKRNMDGIYDTFDAIAIPEFYANVDRYGNLVSLGEGTRKAGYLPAPAKDYDLTPIEQATGVTLVDVRSTFGAYLQEAPNAFISGCMTTQITRNDVIIFTVTGQEPVVIPRNQSGTIPMTVQWSALGLAPEVFGNGLRLENRLPHYLWGKGSFLPGDVEIMVEPQSSAFYEDGEFGDLIFEPGKQYIVACEYASYSHAGSEILSISHVTLYSTAYHNHEEQVLYQNMWEIISEGMITSQHVVDVVTEDFWETDAGAFFTQAIQATQLNTGSFTTITTNDLNAILPFHEGDVRMVDGRAFTEEEYRSGASVCIVSEEVASVCGWKVGDTVDLSFFQATFPYSGKATDYHPSYNAFAHDPDIQVVEIMGNTYYFYNMAEQDPATRNFPFDNFFDQGTYEIVGIYGGKVTGLSSSSGSFNRNVGFDWRMMFVPEASVKNAPAAIPDQYNTSIRLDVLNIQTFLAEMSSSGLMEKQNGAYELRLSVYDQGISGVAPGLYRLIRISRMMLTLACAVALLSVIVLTVLHWLQSKREVAFLRSVGLSKAKTSLAITSGMLVICLLGAITGAVLGQLSADSIAASILAGTEIDEAASAFTASIVQSTEASLEPQSGGVWPAVLSVSAVMLCLAVLLLVFVYRESRKPPLLHLGIRE